MKLHEIVAYWHYFFWSEIALESGKSLYLYNTFQIDGLDISQANYASTYF
jgi:hypothetical protein